jgi:hypothetical protein
VLFAEIGKFGNSEFLHDLFFNQIPFSGDVFDMLVDGRLGFAEELSHVLLRQPDGLFLQMHINFDLAVLILINKNFGVILSLNASRMVSYFLLVGAPVMV